MMFSCLLAHALYLYAQYFVQVLEHLSDFEDNSHARKRERRQKRKKIKLKEKEAAKEVPVDTLTQDWRVSCNESFRHFGGHNIICLLVEDRDSHDFIVDLGITHVPMDTSNVRPTRACQVMNLRSQAVPSL